MSFAYIKQYYQVPAEEGRRVRYRGREGVIVSAEGQYVNICFDAGKKPCGPFHPTDGIEYLDSMGPVPKMTRSQQTYQEFLQVGDLFENFRHFLKYKNAQRKGGAA